MYVELSVCVCHCVCECAFMSTCHCQSVLFDAVWKYTRDGEACLSKVSTKSKSRHGSLPVQPP